MGTLAWPHLRPGWDQQQQQTADEEDDGVLVGRFGPSPLPVLVHVPHASTVVSRDVGANLRFTNEQLAGGMLRLTDPRTDVLAAPTAELGATRFVDRRSRLVADPERFLRRPPGDGGVGMAALYTQGSLRRRSAIPTGRDAELLSRFLDPYAAAFARTVAAFSSGTASARSSTRTPTRRCVCPTNGTTGACARVAPWRGDARVVAQVMW
jgi:hypothetical protein